MAAKKAFGGYQLDFRSVQDKTLGDMFGSEPLPPNEAVKRMWSFVKKHGLGGKKDGGDKNNGGDQE